MCGRNITMEGSLREEKHGERETRKRRDGREKEKKAIEKLYHASREFSSAERMRDHER